MLVTGSLEENSPLPPPNHNLSLITRKTSDGFLWRGACNTPVQFSSRFCQDRSSARAWLEQGCPKWDSGQGPLAPELRVGSLRCLSPSLRHLQPPRPCLSQLSMEHGCWHFIRTSKYEFFLPVSPSSSHCTTP